MPLGPSRPQNCPGLSHIQVIDDPDATDPDIDFAATEYAHCLTLARFSSSRNNGTPSKAVTTRRVAAVAQGRPLPGYLRAPGTSRRNSVAAGSRIRWSDPTSSASGAARSGQRNQYFRQWRPRSRKNGRQQVDQPEQFAGRLTKQSCRGFSHGQDIQAPAIPKQARNTRSGWPAPTGESSHNSGRPSARTTCPEDCCPARASTAG